MFHMYMYTSVERTLVITVLMLRPAITCKEVVVDCCMHLLHVVHVIDMVGVLVQKDINMCMYMYMYMHVSLSLTHEVPL